MGFGHRVYRAEDSRAVVLRDTCQRLNAPRFEVAAALEKAALGELVARRPDRVLATNVEFWAAVLLDFAEVPPRCSPAPALQGGQPTSLSRSARVASSALRRGISARQPAARMT